MTPEEVITILQRLGDESNKKTLVKHGASEPFFGVKIEDLKKIQKRIISDHALALALFETGNSDAMYLAGLIANPSKMTKADLNNWAQKAYWYMISEYTVAWVASESAFGTELALEWIESEHENIASTGWAALACIASLNEDEEINTELYSALLKRVSVSIHSQKNRVRYTMNGFVINVGGYCNHLKDKAFEAAYSIGKIHVDMGGTACKVPIANEYINKMHQRGTLGKKRKKVIC